MTISRQKVLTFHISGSTKHKKVLKTGKDSYFNATEVNIGRANCCHVVLIKTRDTSCVSLEFLSLVLDGVSIQHNVIQLELESIDAVSGET